MKNRRLFQGGILFSILVSFLIACKLFFPPEDTAQVVPSLTSFPEQTLVPTQIEPLIPTATSTGEGGFTCPAPREVQTADQLINLAFDLVWVPTGEYTILPQSITEDIKFLEPVTLKIDDVPAPPRCLDRQDCRPSVILDKSAWVEGVECLEEESVLWMTSCKVVHFEPGDVIRLRATLFDTHPARWNYVPRLELIPSCTVPCQADEFRCSVDNVCWDSYDAYCRLCLGQVAERCACQSPEGNLPDRSECQYWISGDVLFSGKCASGVCQ